MLFLCEIGILLAKQYEIGKNKLFLCETHITSANNIKKETSKPDRLLVSFGV